MRSPNPRNQILNLVGLKEKGKFDWDFRFAMQDNFNQALDRHAKQIREIHIEQHKVVTRQKYAPRNN